MNYKSIIHSIQFAIPMFTEDSKIKEIEKLVKNIGKGLVDSVGTRKNLPSPSFHPPIGKVFLTIFIIYHSNTHNIVEGDIELLEKNIINEITQYLATLELTEETGLERL